MLERLDDVDWAGLTHAYGTADDVPGVIRALRSADAEERGEALDDLHSCLAHQGTRYPATAPAVPFLLALAADPATPDRDGIVEFLMVAATGGVPEDRRRYEPDGEEGAGVHGAVAEGVPLFVTLLADPDMTLAVPAAEALALFPGHAVLSEPALAEAAAAEDAPVPLVHRALLALGAVAPPGTSAHDDLLRWRLSDPDGTVRWAAALTAARLRVPALLPAAIAELGRWAARWAEDRQADGHRAGGRADLALDELAELDPDGHADRLRPILDRLLARRPANDWHHHMSTVLARAGLTGWPLHESRPWEWLSPIQRELVERLCDRPDVFAARSALTPLERCGLPSTLGGLRAYAGR